VKPSDADYVRQKVFDLKITCPAMDNTADTAQVVIRPPLAWGLAVIAGLALNWLVPLPFLRAALAAAKARGVKLGNPNGARATSTLWRR
jgi:hypothetical protein